MRRKPRITTGLAAFPPRQGPLSLGTLHLLPLPVDAELVMTVGPGHFGLPPGFGTWGTDQRNLMVLCTAHQQFGVDIPCIDDMLARGQVAFYQCLLNERGALGVMHGGRCGV